MGIQFPTDGRGDLIYSPSLHCRNMQRQYNSESQQDQGSNNTLDPEKEPLSLLYFLWRYVVLSFCMHA